MEEDFLLAGLLVLCSPNSPKKLTSLELQLVLPS